jgi:predicted nucleic acid-binding protein
MTRLAYVDASAIVKLMLVEPESRAFLRWYVEAERVATSRVGLVETARAARRAPHDPVALERVLRELEVVELDPVIAGAAGTVGPTAVRTLDAIHLATGLVLLPDLDAFVTYDDRMADAARAIGLPVVRPA